MTRKRNLLLIGVVASTAVFGAQSTAAAAPPPEEYTPVAESGGVTPLGFEEARRASGETVQGAAQPRARAAAEATGAATSAGSAFTPMAPTRLLDTRNGTGAPAGAVPAGGIVTIDLSSRVPENATAVVLNVTGVTPTASTVITVWPTGAERPVASTLNLRAGEIRANAATVALGTGRQLDLRNNSGRTHLVADLAGYYAPETGSRFSSIAPTRVLDTRTSGGALGAGATRTINLSNRVPATATAVTFNLTGASATASTVVTAYPAGSARPVASNLNLVPGQVTPNLVTVALGTNRSVTLHNNSGNTHLVADLAGYYATDHGDPFYQMTPQRVYDTRFGEPLGPNEYGIFEFTTEVPASATSLVYNLTGTDPTAPTFLTAYPGGTTRPNASNLNLVARQTAANMAVTRFGSGRELNVGNQAGFVHMIIDIAGYFAPAPAACGTDCVRPWGYNARGQLGVGTTGGFATEPGRIDGLSGLTSVTGGELNGYALRNDGSVWAWGDNGLQGLGDGTPNYATSTVPVRVATQGTITQVVAGRYSAYGLDSNGKAWAWGYNGDGSLGDGSVATRTTPVAVGLPSDVIQLAAGYTTGYALRSNGTVWAWGSNGGSLGNGSYGTGCDTVPVGPGCRAVTPVQVPGLVDVVSIGTSTNATFAVKSDGTVVGWGHNAHGELGLGTAGGPVCYDDPNAPDCTKLSPTPIPGLTDISKIVNGGTSTMYAVRTDGTVLSWGFNGNGQLGNGTTGEGCTDPSGPNCVQPTPTPIAGLTDVKDMAAGGGYALALRADGTVWSWGLNVVGQLGGQWSPTDTPTQVPGLSGARAIGAGYATSFAVT